MTFTTHYAKLEPTREEVDTLTGPVVIEFGASWCGICGAAQPLIAAAFEAHPGVRHIKIEDGRGHRLGRSFGVKLWPTLVFLSEGKEVARLVRPREPQAIREALGRIEPAP